MWSKRAELPNSAFQWCSPDGLPVTNTSVQWKKGQPDNLGGEQRCLHGRVLTNISKLVVSDRNCSDKYVLACETKVTTPPPTCDSPTCPYINCTRKVGAIIIHTFLSLACDLLINSNLFNFYALCFQVSLILYFLE
jgi:hypothetical protein